MAPNSTVVRTDRVTKVQIRPYDQVFALTQYIINCGLQSQWNAMCEAPGSTCGNAFVAAAPGGGQIKAAKLDYPRVMIETGYEEDLTGILYVMTFKSGKFDLSITVMDPETQEPRADEEGNPICEEAHFDMAGWQVVFAMQLGMTLNERSSDDFKRHVLKKEEYSLNDLIAKFETAQFQPEKSIYGSEKWAAFTPATQAGLRFTFGELKHYLLKRINGLQKIGSVLKSNKPSDPTNPKLNFEPKAIQYQTYPWINPGAIDFKPTSGFAGNQRLNYMLYCEVTKDNELPPIHERMLPRKGNWTDGRLELSANSDNCEFGSFHMARENFFDGYLLKKLRFLNRALEPSASFNAVRLADIVNIIPDWDTDLNIGNRKDKSETDSFYNWVPNGDNEWCFSSKSNPKEEHDQAGHNGWSGEAWANTYIECENRIVFNPGSDIIEVSGKSSVRLSYAFVNKHIFKSNDRHEKELHFIIDWKMTLDLEAVDDGGLQILTTFGEPELKIKREDLAGEFKRGEELKNQVYEAMKNTKGFREALISDLKDKQSLVLPASGVFFFKNPLLSHRGDLICSIGYSEVPPEKAFNPDDTTKINAETKPRDTV